MVRSLDRGERCAPGVRLRVDDPAQGVDHRHLLHLPEPLVIVHNDLRWSDRDEVRFANRHRVRNAPAQVAWDGVVQKGPVNVHPREECVDLVDVLTGASVNDADHTKRNVRVLNE